MNKHLIRWTYIVFLLCIQLAAGILPAVAAHRHTLLQEISIQEARQDYFENLLAKLPVHIEPDDDLPDYVYATKHRRKTRFYISASSQQFSFDNRVAYIDTNTIANSSCLPVDKTGEYRVQKAFLPTYYSFLFRFTPF
ncbi:hypothetical protein [Chitinophaga vietnamensis]|uniref:hypothetical protein n=1 Tax=Chitinophaga vietnamensis TaxID=2593957 RepID=UPI0011787C7B|nr:hypothetical protein [Chitinophaga vietnamensis]